MVVADFRDGSTKTYTKTLFQHDKGQRLTFEGIEISSNAEAHFSNQEEGGISSAVKIQNESVPIPNAYLETGEYVYVWLYARTVQSATPGTVNYHVEQTDDDARFVIDSAKPTKQGFENSESLYQVIIPVKKRPVILRTDEIGSEGEGVNVEQDMVYDVQGENMSIHTTGNDGEGQPSFQNYIVDGETLRFTRN